jgi:hypothetical protein
VSAKALPVVCAWCERVRTTADRWERVEGPAPVASESTHGICPDCLDEVQQAAALEAAAPVSLSRAGARPRP